MEEGGSHFAFWRKRWEKERKKKLNRVETLDTFWRFNWSLPPFNANSAHQRRPAQCTILSVPVAKIQALNQQAIKQASNPMQGAHSLTINDGRGEGEEEMIGYYNHVLSHHPSVILDMIPYPMITVIAAVTQCPMRYLSTVTLQYCTRTHAQCTPCKCDIINWRKG